MCDSFLSNSQLKAERDRLLDALKAIEDAERETAQVQQKRQDAAHSEQSSALLRAVRTEIDDLKEEYVSG